MVLAGCSVPSSLPESVPDVRAVRLDQPVYEPVWSRSNEALFALVDDVPAVAEIDPQAKGPPGFTLSGRLAEVGENITTSPAGHGGVYVPQPGLDRIAILGLSDLRPRGKLHVGHGPSYVSVDSGSQTLLALSENGRTVTGVDLADGGMLPARTVPGGPLSEVEGPKRGRLIDYHVLGPQGIVHYKGAPGGVHDTGRIQIPVSTSTGDKVKASRSYVAKLGSSELLAVDTKRGGSGLEVVARGNVGAPIEELGTDEMRVFAATEDQLIVLESNSFAGFTDGHFEVLKRIDYRGALPTEKLKHTPLSGLAVGAERVYLTLDGEPYMVSVATPPI